MERQRQDVAEFSLLSASAQPIDRNRPAARHSSYIDLTEVLGVAALKQDARFGDRVGVRARRMVADTDDRHDATEAITNAVLERV